MRKQDVRVRSSGGGAFDCHLVTPEHRGALPALVLASSIYGDDQDLREVADELAGHGAIVATPDLFWRTEPGALPRGDERARSRAEPRMEKIRTGEQDLADTLASLGALPAFNGKAAVIGFCYGGPYAILGPSRLGYHAGLACHGTQMLDYLPELEHTRKPVCVMWGDQDRLAPPDVREAYQALAARSPNVQVQVLSRVRHGYMMRGNHEAFDRSAYDATMRRACAMLGSLR